MVAEFAFDGEVLDLERIARTQQRWDELHRGPKGEQSMVVDEFPNHARFEKWIQTTLGKKMLERVVHSNLHQTTEEQRRAMVQTIFLAGAQWDGGDDLGRHKPETFDERRDEHCPE